MRLAALHDALTNSEFRFPGNGAFDEDSKLESANENKENLERDDEAHRMIEGRLSSAAHASYSESDSFLPKKPTVKFGVKMEALDVDGLPWPGAQAVGESSQKGHNYSSSNMGLEPPSLRVLVVDDDATQRNLVVHALLNDGFSVDSVGDGFEAVDRTARVAYDAVLMDGFMPVQVSKLKCLD